MRLEALLADAEMIEERRARPEYSTIRPSRHFNPRRLATRLLPHPSRHVVRAPTFVAVRRFDDYVNGCRATAGVTSELTRALVWR
jgi:hypothetical protein